MSLLIDPITYPKHKEDENRMRLITFTLLNTDLLNTIKKALMENETQNKAPIENILSQLTNLSPPYYYSTSLLIETYQKNKTSPYLTRPLLLRMITLELLTQPFLLDHLSHRMVTDLATKLPFKDMLNTAVGLFYDEHVHLDDMAVAGLLMNMTELSDIDSGKYLDGALVSLTLYCPIFFIHANHIHTQKRRNMPKLFNYY